MMKTRSTILLILLCVLANNTVLAGVLWLDQCCAAADVSVSSSRDHDDGDHSQHASHCCHLQAHFQTLVAQSTLLADVLNACFWQPKSVNRSPSLAFSPPTPPPKS